MKQWTINTLVTGGYLLSGFLMIPMCIYIAKKEEKKYITVLAESTEEVHKRIKSWSEE